MKVKDIWFNPLLEKSVSTNVGKIVLPLISNQNYRGRISYTKYLIVISSLLQLNGKQVQYN